MDFAFFRDFSYGCKQVFSSQALGPHRRGGPVPRSVLFAGQRLHRHRQHLHLRAGRARPRRPAARGARPGLRPDLHSFYESTLALYTDQYPIFGDPEVLPVKVIWDYTYYWGVLSQFFFQRGSPTWPRSPS
jgi:hypothetical protein